MALAPDTFAYVVVPGIALTIALGGFAIVVGLTRGRSTSSSRGVRSKHHLAQ